MRRQTGAAQAAAAGLALLLAAGTATAAPVQFVLQPGAVQLRIQAYGLGMIPIEGQFMRFRGTLTLDRDDPNACTLALSAESASIDMGSGLLTEDAKGPDLLDVATYPEVRIEGACTGGRLEATLLLHGISKPVRLAVERREGSWRASGLVRRAEWGMGARPALAGPEVRISMTAGVPAGFAR